ncbi:uncharacterized protein V1510DRAFT_431432 [Dipodascopsis tothii]|uniref:uncharacterized protein n=1 Tax=Dipodascopsis tothii TaxID=44089 RepID=UPI0034CD716D
MKSVFKRNFAKGKQDPEGQAHDAVAQFCDRRRRASAGSESEVVALPVIVDTAAASPRAAREAVRCVRKRLDLKHGEPGEVQYHAAMVLRVLLFANSPTIAAAVGDDKKLAPVLRTLLTTRDADPSVRSFVYDVMRLAESRGELRALPELDGLRAMFRDIAALDSVVVLQKSQGHPVAAPPADPAKPANLAEEAKHCAGLLRQIVQTLPPAQLGGNELALEFYERCTVLQRQIQTMLAHTTGAAATTTLLAANDDILDALDVQGRALDRASKLVSPPREHYEAELAPEPAPGPAAPAGEYTTVDNPSLRDDPRYFRAEGPTNPFQDPQNAFESENDDLWDDQPAQSSSGEAFRPVSVFRY